MTLETESQHFRGVVCLHCKAPIPVPSIVGRVVVQTDEGEQSWQENSSVFALRCPTCQKEKPYRTREIVDFEGTPQARIPTLRPASARILEHRGISKAAKA